MFLGSFSFANGLFQTDSDYKPNDTLLRNNRGSNCYFPDSSCSTGISDFESHLAMHGMMKLESGRRKLVLNVKNVNQFFHSGRLLPFWSSSKS